MRSGLRINLALCVAVMLSLIVIPAPRASAAGAPIAVDAAIVLAADVSRSIDDIVYATLDGQSHTLRGMLAAN